MEWAAFWLGLGFVGGCFFLGLGLESAADRIGSWAMDIIKQAQRPWRS